MERSADFFFFFFKEFSWKHRQEKEQTLNNEPVNILSAKFFHCWLECCWNLVLLLYSMQRSSSSGLLTIQWPQDNISETVTAKSCDHNKCVQFLFFFKSWKNPHLSLLKGNTERCWKTSSNCLFAGKCNLPKSYLQVEVDRKICRKFTILSRELQQLSGI